jgi:DNA-binding winged helix-turn-helix (wHTH) protein/tetratricopeptide (TPR) repeat protein
MDRPIALDARSVSLAIEPPFQLGRARVDPEAHEYRIGDKATRIQPQALKVLIALHDKSGRVVSRDELIDRCWSGRIVGDDVINRCISVLRPFAAESGGFRIETISGAGYRLIEDAAPAAKPRRLPKPWIMGGAAAALTLVLAGIAGWAWLDRPTASQGVPPAPNITVARFVVETNDPLARQIAQAAPLSVERMMADSGFAIVHEDSSTASSSDYVFTGNVRRTATSVDATVQMISKRDGTVAFAHDFSSPIDRAADLPDRIGATVLTELGWTGAAMVLDPAEHLNPQTRSELMSAIILTIEGDESLRAYQLDRHAAMVAPNSAFAQLSFAILTGGALSSIPRGERAEALALGRRASDRGRALAPEFGDVYISWCLLHSRVRKIECEANLRRGLEVDPRSSSVPGFLSFLLHDAGLVDEALRFARQSLANDPYRPPKMRQMMRMLELAGDSSEAQQVYEKATRIWPDADGMRGNRFAGMAERGNYAGMAALAAPGLGGPVVDPPAFTALLAAQRKHDLAGVQRACSTKGLSDFTMGMCMTILADLGDLDRSFAIAKDLYPASQAPPGEDKDRYWLDHPDGFDTGFLAGPAGKSMRTDPRFLVLADKLGLLAYWRSGRLPDFCTKAHEAVCNRITGEPRG